MKAHHIGYLVKDMQSSRRAFESLGFAEVSALCHDTDREINILFMENNGHVVELISPTSDTSVVTNLINKYANMAYHICYETESIEESTKELKAQGFVMTAKPKPASALDNHRVAFFYNKSVGMIELLEV